VGRPREGSSFATGDAVRVAARLEQAAEPDQVLVGRRTAALVVDAFDFSEARWWKRKRKPAASTRESFAEWLPRAARAQFAGEENLGGVDVALGEWLVTVLEPHVESPYSRRRLFSYPPVANAKT
jgi:class 3 adenylate cyclase